MMREDRFLDLFGKIDDKYVLDALPKNISSDREQAKEENNYVRKAAVVTPTEENIEITKKDIRIYWITRILGAAATIALVGTGVFLLWKNWDKIAVRDPDRPGDVTTVTTVSEPIITNDTTSPNTTEPDIVDRFEQITDTSMPENPFDLPPVGDYEGLEYYVESYVFRFDNIDSHFADLVDRNELVEWINEHEQEKLKMGYGIEPLTVLAFVEKFGITKEQLTEAAKLMRDDKYTKDFALMDEDIDIIYSGDKKKIIEHFRAEYAVLGSDRAYSPMWLYEHTTEAYKAAGIDPRDILDMLPAYEKMFRYNERNMTDEAWRAFLDKLLRYVNNSTIEGYANADDWGIYAGITNKNRYGLTYYVNRLDSLDERYWGDVRYSDAYIVEKFDNYKWNKAITQYDDMYEHTLSEGATNEHEIKFGQRLEPGKYRLLLFFDRFENAVTPEIAKLYLEFEIYPVRQTFDVKYYYKNDLAGIAAGYYPPFQSSPHDMYADGSCWEWIGYAECKDFFKNDHNKFPNEVPDELIDILRNYADGDDLKPDLGGNFAPITERYQILSNNEAYPSGEGITSYRIGYMPGNDFLITMGWDNKILVFRENKKYTAARKIMELLWDNYGENFDVFAVLDSNNGERVEYLMIVASENFFVIGEEERYNVLERVKSLLAEHDMLDDDLIKFMSPEQFRDTWIPVEIIDDTGRLNGDMIRVADRVFRLVNAENMEFDEYKKFLADNGVITPDASRETVFNLGEAVTPYRDIFDILDIQACDDYDMWHYGQITDEIIHSTAISVDTNNVWVYDKALSQAVWKTVHLRCLQELCPQIKKIDLVVSSEPDEYRIVVHASVSDQELLKKNEAFQMFYDPELVEFAE